MTGSAPPRRLDRGNVDFSHRHHGFECALGDRRIGVGYRRDEGARHDLPLQAPPILAPAALACLPAIADDRVPQAVGFGLVVGSDLKRERLVVPELRAAVQPQAGDACHGELNREDIALLAGGIVARRAMHGAHAVTPIPTFPQRREGVKREIRPV